MNKEEYLSKKLRYEQNVKIARIFLIALAFLSVFNLLMSLVGAKYYFLVGASLPIYILNFSRTSLQGLLKVLGIFASVLMILSYFLFYFFVKKKPSMFLCPTIFYGVDALFEIALGIGHNMIDMKSLILHALFIFYFVLGYVSGSRIKEIRKAELHLESTARDLEYEEISRTEEIGEEEEEKIEEEEDLTEEEEAEELLENEKSNDTEK